MVTPDTFDSSAIKTFDTGLVIDSHVGDHAVVVAVGPEWAQDPSIQLITGDWAVTVQVARCCVGPSARRALLYGPTVLLISVRDSTTGRRPDKRKGVFPINRLLAVVPVAEDDIDLKDQYTHIHKGDAYSIRNTWQNVLTTLFKLGQEATSGGEDAWATCRIAGREVFAENGVWADSNGINKDGEWVYPTLTEFPKVHF